MSKPDARQIKAMAELAGMSVGIEVAGHQVACYMFIPGAQHSKAPPAGVLPS